MPFSHQYPPLRHRRRPCFVLRPLFLISCCLGVDTSALGSRSPLCRPGHCAEADASVPCPTPAALRLPGFLSAAAFFGAASAAHTRTRASARAPVSAPLGCSTGALAASRARCGGTRGVAPREATIASGCLLSCRLSVACGLRSPVFLSPSLVVGPYLWLLHFLGTHYCIGINNCWLGVFAVQVTRSRPMAGFTIY